MTVTTQVNTDNNLKNAHSVFNVFQSTPYTAMTEEELMLKLALSKEHANQGRYKDADSVIYDIRSKYEL